MSPTSFMVKKIYVTSFLNGKVYRYITVKNVLEPFSDFKQIIDV